MQGTVTAVAKGLHGTGDTVRAATAVRPLSAWAAGQSGLARSGPGSGPAWVHASPSREWPDSDLERLSVASAAACDVISLPTGKDAGSRGALDAGPRDTALAKQRSAAAGGGDMSGAKCTCRPRG